MRASEGDPRHRCAGVLPEPQAPQGRTETEFLNLKSLKFSKFSKIAIWRREIGDLDMYVYGWEWVIVVAAFASCIFVNVQMDRSAWLQLYSEETLKESNVVLSHF